jgi:hypothetical protein
VIQERIAAVGGIVRCCHSPLQVIAQGAHLFIGEKFGQRVGFFETA